MPCRPLLRELGLRGAIADLLAPERADGVAPMMPDHRCGAEADLSAGILDAPAHVDVVSGNTKTWIEPTQRAQDLATERHVASGNVLRDTIRKHHVRRVAGRIGDAFGDRAVSDGRDVGSAHGVVTAVLEG